jgi:hypothetical protein
MQATKLMQPKFGSLLWIAFAAVAPHPALAQAPFDPPAQIVLTEARSIVQGMVNNPRGPYSRIRWFCSDGTVQPPVAFACREHGGGRQHAEYSGARGRLAELGWSVGTIYAALSWEELFDAGRRHQRLRELALEKYLTDIDDGWVLRQARNYRGRAQVETEEAVGRELLIRLLSDRDWLAANYLLMREAVRVIPHGGSAEDRTRDIRREAVELAERDSSFEALRAEIHSAPSASTPARVRAWARGKALELGAIAQQLAAKLEGLYGAAGRTERLSAHRQALSRAGQSGALAQQLAFDYTLAADVRLQRVANILVDARNSLLSPSTTPPNRLLQLDLIVDLESELVLTSAEVLDNAELSRGELLELARKLIDASYGSGLLTEGEHATLHQHWQIVDAATALSLDEYADLIAYLRRIPQWAAGSVRYVFAEPLVRYAALDPRAASFVDDVLRSSPLIGMAEISRRLARDLAYLTGVTQSVEGDSGVPAFGLNPGIALGPLALFETQDALEHGSYERTDIVVLPETVAELAPVAGIVTLGEGNPLSHVQLLARNFGIPNIAIAPALLPGLRPLQGREVLAAVASDGSLVLTAAQRLDPALLSLVLPANRSDAALTVPPPDLSRRQPLQLAELNSSLSGVVVGPKAANLGQLARLFPGRVAPAIALPFGIFAEHLNLNSGDIRARLMQVYAEREAGLLSEDEAGTALAAIRDDITALHLTPAFRDELLQSMRAEFGELGSYGLFVRSDTNVEDLPQFTGAGLSETLPNITELDRLLTAIPRVWASVLSPRAIAWRSSLLTNPEEVYASVLLMQSVPSDKSGVMVTADLTTKAKGLTVSVAWGVGGAVAGEAAATIVLHEAGGQTLVSEAKVAYQRNLNAAGGLQWRPAPDGPVLTDDEKRQLRELAREVSQKYSPVHDENGQARPWDIEFGFVAGELTLFQIRPLVERGPQLADRIVRAITPRPQRAAPDRIVLTELPVANIG